ncbi:probable LRR receptor-like serine/threonine-protein kinase At1g67720 isoform X1 [Helianthus annuus]|uniref:probable LRR receptor-like serine/threonine-protein kinase At1g67720 isoform X1 n=1 Tax=Helianthus annuus TaxID=4232 RepID=UPI000B8F63DC|nr:probable LRR receptor-like serine/threonine-protein kinase At1g67720 isoform X1 [Helianthus annuus]
MDTVTGESSSLAQLCYRFSLEDIQSATNNFDDTLVIGHGGFGKVYKGCVHTDKTSQVVAVKRLDSMSNQGVPEFRAEIEMLSKLRHRHLVSLIGFCDDNKEMILVYEYMPHGTLYDHLHKDRTPLSWVQRVKIAMGAARGLDYLHTGTLHGVIHRDVKSSNILLDENWEAMISDFGLSKIGSTNQLVSYVDASVKGTFGYLDPEYFYTNKLTRKTDVYAFGVVLFELLSGRLPVDERNVEEEYSLVRWAQKCVRERKIDQMVDSNIKGTISTKCLRRFTKIAYRCVHGAPKERPTMTEVVASLQALLELPDKSNHSEEASGIMGFTWKMHKYIVSTTKPNSGPRNLLCAPKMVESPLILEQSRTSSPQSLNYKIEQHEKLVTRDIKMFTYDELKLATRNFGNDAFLVEGSYGKVYKGWLNKTTYSPCKDDAELPIAVKKLHRYTLFDLELLKEFHHPNLVKFLGYCLEGERLFLVHEFMRNGNFKDLLHSGAIARLPLATKVKILVGIARGIVFLQKPQFNKTCFAISESELYRHKILLDEDFTAKLSVNGKYAAPDNDGLELVLQSNLSGYEVVFIEILTGERIFYLNKLLKIDRLFRECGKDTLSHIAQFCYKICDEVDSESKMLKMLKEHDKLIQRRLKNWLSDPDN